MAIVLVSRFEDRLAVARQIDVRLSPVYRLPSVVTWNRLEGRPRSDDLTRPIRAEVRDPAWMLARQWQFDEGSDWESAGPAGGDRARTIGSLRP
jgi:hypothetical protein